MYNSKKLGSSDIHAMLTVIMTTSHSDEDKDIPDML